MEMGGWGRDDESNGQNLEETGRAFVVVKDGN